MPVGISAFALASDIQPFDLFLSEIPAHRSQVLAQLFLIARADDDARNRRALRDPIQCNLREGFAGFSGNRVDHIHEVIEELFGNRRAFAAALLDACTHWQRIATAEAPAETSSRQRTPDQHPYVL